LLSGKIQARRTEVTKSTRARYTLEFKLEAVRMVKGGQSLAVVSKVLDVSGQTLHNWVKAERKGALAGPGSKPVSPEQMEIARLRAELARVKMERDILGKATAYFAKERE
jgi:transposase